MALLILQALDEEAIPNEPKPVQNSEASKFKTQISNIIPSALPIATSTNKIPPRKQSMLDYSTPPVMVSAFCRAVLSHLLPSDFWGTGDTKAANEKAFLQNVDRFIELRRFESLSLHEVSQGLKVCFYKARE
jgi:telomerase reverse transcriptase